MGSYRRDSLLPPLWVLLLITTAVLGWVAYQLKEIVVLFVVGYSVAYAVDPLLERLERYGISRPTGVFVLSGLLCIMLLLMVFSAVPTFVSEYERLLVNLPSYQQTLTEKSLAAIEEVRHLLPASLIGEDLTAELMKRIGSLANAGTVGAVLGGIGSTLLGGYSLTLTVFNLALLPFIVYYLAVDLPQLHVRAMESVPHLKQAKAKRIVREIDGYVSAFIRGQLLVCTVLFILYAIGFWSIGLELWLLLAFIGGYGNLIPYLGTVMAIVLCSIVAIVTSHTLSLVFWVWGVLATVQLLEGMVITPKILGDQVGLSPLVILLAICAGGQLFGLLGVFLAIPGAAILRVLIKYAYGWVMVKL